MNIILYPLLGAFGLIILLALKEWLRPRNTFAGTPTSPEPTSKATRDLTLGVRPADGGAANRLASRVGASTASRTPNSISPRLLRLLEVNKTLTK